MFATLSPLFILCLYYIHMAMHSFIIWTCSLCNRRANKPGKFGNFVVWIYKKKSISLYKEFFIYIIYIKISLYIGGGVYTLNEHKGSVMLSVCSRFVLSTLLVGTRKPLLIEWYRECECFADFTYFLGRNCLYPSKKILL